MKWMILTITIFWFLMMYIHTRGVLKYGFSDGALGSNSYGNLMGFLATFIIGLSIISILVYGELKSRR